MARSTVTAWGRSHLGTRKEENAGSARARRPRVEHGSAVVQDIWHARSDTCDHPEPHEEMKGAAVDFPRGKKQGAFIGRRAAPSRARTPRGLTKVQEVQKVQTYSICPRIADFLAEGLLNREIQGSDL